jgi:hypothetical protein
VDDLRQGWVGVLEDQPFIAGVDPLVQLVWMRAARAQVVDADARAEVLGGQGAFGLFEPHRMLASPALDAARKTAR